MFAAIYRFYIRQGREKEYQKNWRKIASYFVAHKGALGSSLHRGEDGLWVAYSRWPSKAMRDAAWPGDKDPSMQLPHDIRQAIAAIKECSDHERKLPELCMEVVDDL